MKRRITAFAALGLLPIFASAQDQWSGIYPHLAYFNGEGECGTERPGDPAR